MRMGKIGTCPLSEGGIKMVREDTVFQILDFLAEEEMPFESLCEEMERYHPQVPKNEISLTLDYLLEEQMIRISREQWITDEAGKGTVSQWHGITGKGKENYYRMVKRRFPED